MRIFLDANILFSAAHSPEGGARELFRLAAAGRCVLFSSPHAMLEARRNLAVKSETGSSRLEGLVASVHLVQDAGPKLVSRARSFGLPENDAPILAAAIAAGVDLLVTGDRKHFGHLFGSSVGRVRIVTLVEALEALIAP